MKTMTSWLTLALLMVPLGLISGCATTSESPSVQDPYVRANRVVFRFNSQVDRLLLKPAAKGYERILPEFARKGVSNFFSNLWEPMTITNDLLQGNIDAFGQNTARFLLNSTVGVFGLFDVAKHFDLPKRSEDFGQTLATWGVPSGPYLVLPLLGPSNARDALGLVPQWFHADLVNRLDSPDRTYASLIRLIDTRVRLFGLDDLLQLQPDQYLFLRENYHQMRTAAILNGELPEDAEQDLEDELIDELLEFE